MKFPGFPGAGKDSQKPVLLLGGPHPMGCSRIPQGREMGWEKLDLGGIKAGKAEPSTKFPGHQEGLGKMGFLGSRQ